MEEVLVRCACSLKLTFVLVLYDPATCNFSTNIIFFFSFFFLKHRDSWGASRRFLPSLPASGACKRFSPKDIFIPFSIFSFSFLFFYDQGVGGVETGLYSTTSTDLSKALMNSYLERGFL